MKNELETLRTKKNLENHLIQTAHWLAVRRSLTAAAEVCFDKALCIYFLLSLPFLAPFFFSGA